MYRPLEFFVGLRYTRAKRRNGFISFISSVSILSIVIGVMALIIVLSVMNGFEKEMRERILNMIAHITVTGYGEKIQDWQAIVKRATENPQITAAAPFIRGEGMLMHRREVNGALFRGIDPEYESRVSKIATHMLHGKLSDLKPGEFGIILGRELAYKLGVGVGDKITMVTPSANITPAGVIPRLKRFTVKGIFYVGFYEYDSGTSLIHLQDAQRIFRMPGKVHGVQLQTTDILNVKPVLKQIQEKLFPGLRVLDWSYSHSNWFKAVEMEKRLMFLLLFLIMIVAAINIISTLVMVVTDKKSDIAILRTFGASTGTVMRIFIIQGSVIGVVGTLLGTSLGVFVSLNIESWYNWWGADLIDPSVYYISTLPADLHWQQVGWISLATFVTSILATILPALRASRIQPASALRYE